MSDAGPVRLFVYGTLAPGQPAWPRLADLVTEHRTATVPGRLYDTGRGYPAAVFGSGGSVHGACCDLANDTVLTNLDRWEGSEYERVRVEVDGDGAAWAYAWRAPLTGCRLLPDGRWPE